MSVIEIDSLDELIEIVEDNEKVVVEFGASWCGPCRVFRPHFEKFAEDRKSDGAVCVYATIENDPALSAAFGIQSIPQLKLFRDGEYKGDLKARTVMPLFKEFNELVRQ